MEKDILFKDEARTKLAKGVNKLANAVAITYGPRGRNVAIDQGGIAPKITNDGVSVAKEISLTDRVENMGATVIKQVAEQANECAGDGTTASSVLARAIFNEGLKNIIAGQNPITLKKGIIKSSKLVLEELQKISKKITDQESLKNVATISAEDKEMGQLIADIFQEIGKDGVVAVEKSNKFGMEKEVVVGTRIEKGYISPYFITNSQKMETEIDNPSIIIYDGKISSVDEIAKILNIALKNNKKDLFLLCEDLEGEALAVSIVNKLKGIINFLAIKSPGYGDNKRALMEDVAALTGATVIAKDFGLTLDTIKVEYFGSADKIKATKDNTIIINGKGNTEDIKKREDEVRTLLSLENTEFQKEKLEQRLSRLIGGVALLKIGAPTEMEQNAILDKAEDAINATRAAFQEGIVPGGGVALLRTSNVLKDIQFETEEEKLGADIVRRALLAPITTMLENAGLPKDVIIEKIINNENIWFGFDIIKETYGDLYELGIIDPLKVVKSSLENAVSASATLLTTDCVVFEEVVKDKKDEE